MAKDRLDETLAELEKRFGAGTVMRLGNNAAVNKVDVIPTGAINLDAALGIGGVPVGRVTEIYGMEASGKTTLALHIAAQAQKQGGTVAFIDAEHALDAAYAGRIGVDVDKLLLSQPDSGEQALEVMEALVRSDSLELVVLDSVAALVPRAEIEGEMGDSHVGLQARLMSQALRKLTSVISKSRTAVIFINQIRMKIGGMINPYMNPETTSGGVALKFYSTVRLEVRKGKALKDATNLSKVYGSMAKVKVVKNKLAPPFKVVEFPIIYGEGISHKDIVLELAVQEGIVERSGAWFSYDEVKLGQGLDKAKAYFIENPELLEKLEEEVRASLGMIGQKPEVESQAETQPDTQKTED